MKSQISILGCGWLGFPLAKKLVEDGFIVKGSTTQASKLETLTMHHIEGFVIEINEKGIRGDVTDFLNESHVLIINIPPNGQRNNLNYKKKLYHLIPFIEHSTIKKIIFVSSTIVYDNQFETITETTAVNPKTAVKKDIFDSEQLFQNLEGKLCNIVRFGGLIGEERHPIKFLAGKTNIPNPNHAINLIHLKDCINLIIKIIEKDSWGHVFIGVNPITLSRKEYYTKKAKEYRLSIPIFNVKNDEFDKKIDNPFTSAFLGFECLNDI